MGCSIRHTQPDPQLAVCCPSNNDERCKLFCLAGCGFQCAFAFCGASPFVWFSDWVKSVKDFYLGFPWPGMSFYYVLDVHYLSFCLKGYLLWLLLKTKKSGELQVQDGAWWKKHKVDLMDHLFNWLIWLLLMFGMRLSVETGVDPNNEKSGVQENPPD